MPRIFIKRNFYPNIEKDLSWEDAISIMMKSGYKNFGKTTRKTQNSKNVLDLIYKIDNFGEFINSLPVGDCQFFYSEDETVSHLAMHNDNHHVLIIQHIGKMKYMLDSQDVILDPGDALLIEKGALHGPKLIEQRNTLTFKVKKYEFDNLVKDQEFELLVVDN